MKYQTGEKPTPPPPAVVDGTPADDPTPVGWLDARPLTQAADAPIQFVHESDGDAWAALPRFWNEPPTDAQKAAAALAIFPGAVGPLPAVQDVVRIKVPAGLDNPRDFLPSPDHNPPTRNKWQLGRRLFFDKGWLTDAGGESCASCHDPRTAFADRSRDHHGLNTPTLLNCVFNRRQFWDGRVQALEQVVQRTVEDETTPADKLPFHVWGGVVRRLRAGAEFRQLFRNVFGGLPTEDAVGKALATYLRTLLAAGSVHDRAEQARGAGRAPEMKAEHYEKALDDEAMKRLGLEKDARADAAKKIYRGYRLFHDLEPRKTGCLACHGGREFTDGGFHNLGVGFTPFEPGKEPGRFASLPVGEKDRALIGAWKTPTLRGLWHTPPYFHDGSAALLEEALLLHADGGQANDYLDPALRPRDLPEQDMADLILFLRALDGEGVDRVLLPPE